MPAALRSDLELAAPIRCILSDVDGVLTNGQLIYDSTGIESKTFHVRDGLGIKRWMSAGLHFGIITARKSEMVARRAKELGIPMLAQNASNKLQAAKQMADEYGFDLSSVCYIGDDLPDIPVMEQVGLAAAPADAAEDARDAAHWILRQRGGEGAVRELIERLMRASDRWCLPEGKR
ncbi:MAG: HAD-IIIA family hydrolase [Planctomycetota bacterium]